MSLFDNIKGFVPVFEQGGSNNDSFLAIKPTAGVQDVLDVLGGNRIYPFYSDKFKKALIPNSSYVKSKLPELQKIGEVSNINDTDAIKFLTNYINNYEKKVSAIHSYQYVDNLINIRDEADIFSKTVEAATLDPQEKQKLITAVNRLKGIVKTHSSSVINDTSKRAASVDDDELLDMYNQIQKLTKGDPANEVVREAARSVDQLKQVLDTRNLNRMDAENKKRMDIAKHIQAFMDSDNQEPSFYEATYYAIMAEIDENANLYSPEDLKIMKTGVEEIAKTKYGLADLLQKKKNGKLGEAFDPSNPKVNPANPSNPNLSDAKPNGQIKTEAFQEGDVWEFTGNVSVPLGQTVILDLKTLQEGSNGRVSSFFAKTGKMMREVFGYEPEGDSAKVIGKYQHLRDFVGSGVQFSTRNTIGVLLGIAQLPFKGKKGYFQGLKTGEQIGEVVRYDMLQRPQDVNPRILDFEEWLRNKANINKKRHIDVVDVSPEAEMAAARKEERKLATENIRKTNPVKEDMGVAIPPVAINPDAPANPVDNSTEGSGDKFNELNVTKKKKKEIEEDSKIVKVNEYVKLLDTFGLDYFLKESVNPKIKPTKELLNYVKDRVVELLNSPSIGLYREPDTFKRDWMPESDSSFPEYIRMTVSRESFDKYKVGAIKNYYAKDTGGNLNNRPLDVTITLYDKKFTDLRNKHAGALQQKIDKDELLYELTYQINVDNKGTLIR